MVTAPDTPRRGIQSDHGELSDISMDGPSPEPRENTPLVRDFAAGSKVTEADDAEEIEICPDCDSIAEDNTTASGFGDIRTPSPRTKIPGVAPLNSAVPNASATRPEVPDFGLSPQSGDPQAPGGVPADDLPDTGLQPGLAVGPDGLPLASPDLSTGLAGKVKLDSF